MVPVMKRKVVSDSTMPFSSRGQYGGGAPFQSSMLTVSLFRIALDTVMHACSWVRWFVSQSPVKNTRRTIPGIFFSIVLRAVFQL